MTETNCVHASVVINRSTCADESSGHVVKIEIRTQVDGELVVIKAEMSLEAYALAATACTAPAILTWRRYPRAHDAD